MLIGQQIGPFVIEGELGSGAMGTVYRARLQKDDKLVPVALKVISFGLLGNESAMARFDREAAILKQLKHPHIVRLIGTGRYKQTPFIAMEFVDGQSLDKKLALKGHLSWEETADVAKQLCKALQYAHEKGIVHRDLKPSNLMATPGGVLKLTDFGIAKDADLTALTGANSTIGTAAYMSPEQCRGDRNISAKSDLYSLGVVLYELLTGRKPFAAESTVDMFLKHVNEVPVRPRKLVPDLPVWFDNLVMFLLEKDIKERPLDAATVERMLIDVEEKVRTQQSVGAEVANARRVDRPVGGAVTDEDRAVAKTLRTGGGKKKKKKKTGPWYTRTWAKAVPAAIGLLAVVAGGGYLLYDQLRPEGIDEAYRRVEAAETPDAKRQAAEAFLAAHGRDKNPKADAVHAVYREQRARAAEQILAKWVGRKGHPDVFDEESFRLAMQAIDEERAGRLKPAADLWATLRDRKVDYDPGKFPEDTEAAKADLKWVGEKRAKEASQTAPDQLRSLAVRVADDRIREVERPVEAGSPEAQAIRAIRLEAFGDKAKAKAVWETLASQTEKDVDRHVWFLIAAQQTAQNTTDGKEDPKATRFRLLSQTVDRLEKAAAPIKDDPEARVARRDVRVGSRDVIQLYDDDPSDAIKSLVTRAKKVLESVPKT